MSNELQLYADPNMYSGETVIVRLFDAGVQIGNDINTTEVGTSGHFIADMPTEIEEGKYAVIFYDSLDSIIVQGTIEWDGNQELESGWKVNEIKQIRSVLGLSGDKITAVGGQIQNMQNELVRLLGLGQENYRLYDHEYKEFGENRLCVKVMKKIYENETDFQNNVNPIAIYECTGKYNIEGELIEYGAKRVV